MAKNGEINSSEYDILIKKGADLGLDKETVDLLIKLELGETSDNNIKYDKPSLDIDNNEYSFRAAITRGGSILTPDRLIISKDTVTYKKRNKYLINVDSTSIPISKISSVELDTSILGTDIIIKSFGAGKIICKKFTKSDAKKIKRIIQERSI